MRYPSDLQTVYNPFSESSQSTRFRWLPSESDLFGNGLVARLDFCNVLFVEIFDSHRTIHDAYVVRHIYLRGYNFKIASRMIAN